MKRLYLLCLILLAGCMQVAEQNETVEKVEPEIQEANCIDSDNGAVVLKLGVTVKGSEQRTDECESPGHVKESYCENNQLVTKLMPCPYYHECFQGVCIKQEVPEEQEAPEEQMEKAPTKKLLKMAENGLPRVDWKPEVLSETCTDFEVYKEYPYTTKSNITNTIKTTEGETTEVLFSECKGEDFLNKFICVDNKPALEIYKCQDLDDEIPWSCEDGRCVQGTYCLDGEDGIDPFKRGWISYRAEGEASGGMGEFCQDSNTLVEYSCDGAEVKTEYITCKDVDPMTACIDGACKIPLFLI